MGQCGCGDFYPLWKLPGPDGSQYTIELLPACDYCREPLAVRISQLRGDALDHWEIDQVPDFEMRDLGSKGDHSDGFVLVVDIEKLADKLGFEYDKIAVYHALQEARPKDNR